MDSKRIVLKGSERRPIGTRVGEQPDLAVEEQSRVSVAQVEKTVALLADGATIPFIARYRKEATGNLDEVQIAAVDEIAPYDAVETMMPSPFSCSTRYGISAATPTSATSTPSAGLSYLREKKCDWDTSRCALA